MTDPAKQGVREIVQEWAADAREKLAAGTLRTSDLDRLLSAVGEGNLRQRLLYLHASSPSIYSNLIGGALHEPEAGSVAQIDPLAPELPYESVQEALVDGWRVVHFPQQLAPHHDREIDLMGYEFILEKLEVYGE